MKGIPLCHIRELQRPTSPQRAPWPQGAQGGPKSPRGPKGPSGGQRVPAAQRAPGVQGAQKPKRPIWGPIFWAKRGAQTSRNPNPDLRVQKYIGALGPLWAYTTPNHPPWWRGRPYYVRDRILVPLAPWAWVSHGDDTRDLRREASRATPERLLAGASCLPANKSVISLPSVSR